MEYLFGLLWIIKVGMSFCFIYFCYQVVKIIAKKWGIFYAITFIFGLFTFVIRSNNNNLNKSEIKWRYFYQDSIAFSSMYVQFIDLEKNAFSKYKLGIKYGNQKSKNNNIPVEAFSTTEGRNYFKHWIPLTITINPTDSINQFQYNVYGEIEWDAFGLTIYSEPKNYSGFITIK